MLTKADFESINESDLSELVNAQVPEGAGIEYKKQLYGNSDSDKKELLKDISALANTNGGHLVIGIEEKDGVASSIASISDTNPDSEILRMEQVVRSGIEPPIIGVKMRAVNLADGGYTIVCRIPKSWIGPHRVVAKGHNRFYLRNSAGVFEPGIDELRSMFTQTASTLEQAKAFRDSRISEICSGADLRPLVGNGRLFIHIVPTASLLGLISLDLEVLHSNSQHFWPMGTNGMSPRFNYHGYLCERGGEENYGYVQVFRNGCIEATKGSIVRKLENGLNIPGTGVEELIFNSVPKYIKGLSVAGVPGPFIILITLEGVLGARYAVRSSMWGDESHPLPYDVMRLPEGFLDSEVSVKNTHKAMKPCFDALWNAIGYSQSQNFDENGVWNGNTKR